MVNLGELDFATTFVNPESLDRALRARLAEPQRCGDERAGDAVSVPSPRLLLRRRSRIRTPAKPVFNRITGLRDTWAKMKNRGA